jgi:hypothetical protein
MTTSHFDELPPKPQPPPGPPPRWSLGINLLPFFFGRVGGDVEYAATRTVALVVNVHVDASAALTDTGNDHYVGFGGELGLRYYPKGSLYGFFMGPSVIAGYYSVDYYGSPYPLPNGGVAFDFGGKGHVGKSGFLMVGAGAQHLWSHPYPSDFPWPVAQAIGGGGWPLRLLFSFGWTFL